MCPNSQFPLEHAIIDMFPAWLFEYFSLIIKFEKSELVESSQALCSAFFFAALTLRLGFYGFNDIILFNSEFG